MSTIDRAATTAASPESPPPISSRAKLDAAIGRSCLEWWADLNDVDLKSGKEGQRPNRAALAELRRIGTYDAGEAELIDVSAAIGNHAFPAYLALSRRLGGLVSNWRSNDHLDRFSKRSDFEDAVAVVAATLARVREHKPGKDVARLLGAQSRDDAPLMAEARFKRLIRSSSAPDLLGQGRRIVMLLGRTAPVDDLGASLLLWNADPYAKRRWSFAYYDAADMRAEDLDHAPIND